MKIFLLQLASEEKYTIDQATSILYGLEGNYNNARISPGLADSDLIICDLSNISAAFASALNNQAHNLAKRIKSGAVILCFSGRPIDGNYEWLKALGISFIPEYLAAHDISFAEDLTFTRFFKNHEGSFIHHAIFNRPTSGSFVELAKNKSDDLVAIYSKIGDGHVFVLPRHKDPKFFINSFISELLPLLNVNFLKDLGSVEPMPLDVSSILINGQDTLADKINKENTKILEATAKKEELESELRDLMQWKDLLWQTGIPLENIVKRFFYEIFDIKLTKTDIDLTGEYEGKELFIEVKGNTGTINHNKDFRQIHERKFYNAKDPQNTIALLIGNPFRLLPLDKRPPEHDSLFAKTSIPIAETSGIGLIHTKELFDIVNDVLFNSKINKKKILTNLMNSKGIYKYN